MNPFSRFFLAVALFVCGACVMVLEILGTKVISPFFGVSLYVWSALITVTLLSLSLGYWIGGVLADRFPHSALFYAIIFLAGLAAAAVPAAAPKVISLTESMELRAGTLCSSFLLFFAPLFALGMVSPFAIRLRASTLEAVGWTAGTLYAVSTLGSFAGTILAGFVLVPSISVTQNFYITSGALMMTALLGLWFSRSFKVGMMLTIGFLGFVAYILSMARPRGAEAADSQILHQSQSFYGQIKVVETGGARALMVNGSPQNFVPVGNTDLLKQNSYVIYISSTLIHRPEIKKILMVGLGGGTLPTIFSKYGVTTDVIEIDPRMESVAAEYFGYKRGEGKVHVGDGRYVMKRLTEKYDAVVLDAFAAYDQPAHLLCKEMFEIVKERLNEDGIFALNTAGVMKGDGARFSKAIFRTLQEVFPYVDAYYIDGGELVGSVEFFASTKPLVFASESPLKPEEHGEVVALMQKSHANKALAGGAVMTDDHNPLPYWGVPIYRAWREVIGKYFSKELLEKI